MFVCLLCVHVEDSLLPLNASAVGFKSTRNALMCYKRKFRILQTKVEYLTVLPRRSLMDMNTSAFIFPSPDLIPQHTFITRCIEVLDQVCFTEHFIRQYTAVTKCIEVLDQVYVTWTFHSSVYSHHKVYWGVRTSLFHLNISFVSIKPSQIVLRY